MSAETIAKPPSDTWISRLAPASLPADAAMPFGRRQLNLQSCLEDLPFDFANIDCRCAVRELVAVFTSRPLLAGCIILRDRHYLGLISRRYLFEIMGRPFGVDLFMDRPIADLLDLVPTSFPLPAQAPIAEVAAYALNRPGHLVYEPLAVKMDDGSFGVLNAHT
ncbi:MAG: hypothetical protein N3A66_01910, partial [Planctomycetota bacterium]|nr:hypothetical protein [Planctomycetota bacterium]